MGLTSTLLENTEVNKAVLGVGVTVTDGAILEGEKLGVNWPATGLVVTGGGGGSKSTLTSSSMTMVVAELGSLAN